MNEEDKYEKPLIQDRLSYKKNNTLIGGEDEDEENDFSKKDKKMNRLSKIRFGHQVQFEKFQTSNSIKVLCITLAIIIIPLEIFVQHVLQYWEGEMIISIQSAFTGGNLGNPNGALQFFMKLPLFMVRPNVTCLFMFLLYLSTDSLIAFKSSILTCFGLYFITFLKLLYKDGRPFWLNKDIEGYDCQFDFAGPGYHLYIITFFWTYNIIMYQMKYSEKINYKLVYSMFGVLGFSTVWIIIAGLYTGTIYIYQNIIGMLYGLLYLVFCLNFDREIHRMCEKTGFIVQSSRKYKFYLFFLCIGLFMVALVYYNCEADSWTMPQTWVVYATDDTCGQELLASSNNRLGLDQTFFISSILFFITGMGFGTSYSLVHVDCLDWVRTEFLYRIIRGVLGCGISAGIFVGFQFIPCNDNPTRFFFRYALPALCLSFFIFGIYPILCQKVGLVRVNSSPKVIDVQDVKQVNRRTDILDSIAEQESEDQGTSKASKMMKFNNK